MNLQKTLLNQFSRLYGKPTLRKSSSLTGIGLSRFHRILQGKEMKLNEYVLIKKLIAKKIGMNENFESLSWECMDKLSAQDLFDLEFQMKAKLRKNYYQREEVC